MAARLQRHSTLLRCEILKVFQRQPGLSEVAGAGPTKGSSRHETFKQIKVKRAQARTFNTKKEKGKKKTLAASRGHRVGRYFRELVSHPRRVFITILGFHIFSLLWEQSFCEGRSSVLNLPWDRAVHSGRDGTSADFILTS